MPIEVKDLDLYPTLTGRDLLNLFFDYDTINKEHYLRTNRSQYIAAFKIMDDFKAWMSRAMFAGEFYVVHRGPSFNNSFWDKHVVFRWMHDKRVLLRLEEKGVKIDDALKKAVEKSAKIVQTETTPAPSFSPATQEESKPLNQKSSKPNKTNMGGVSSPRKDKFIKILKDLSRHLLFKKIIKEKPLKQLPYQKQLLENFIDNPEIEIDDNFINSLYSDEKFKEIYGTTPRNLIERWIPEALDSKKPK